jgi:hypothetical protein
MTMLFLHLISILDIGSQARRPNNTPCKKTNIDSAGFLLALFYTGYWPDLLLILMLI